MTKTSATCIDANAAQTGRTGTKRTLTGLILAIVLTLLPRGATAGELPVPLGSAATFAVLAGSTVTTIPTTTINGDLGVFTGNTVTGVPIVNGTLYLGDATAAQAQADLTIAYNDAAGRTLGAIGVAGNLGGLTLTPGLYKSTSSLEISSGDLTLDALGDPNAVWIFQMASTLVTTSGRQVILTGGARAENIFWQVGSSATIGTTSVFKGTIMALASIAMNTGATLEGRALARTGAVTLDANTVGLGIPAVSTTAPTVSSTFPVNVATGVAIDAKIAVVFSETMNPATITTTTFTLKQGTTPVSGRVTYVGVTATFAPIANLAANTTYTATITTAAKDLAGNALAATFVWSFTTSPIRDTTRPTVTYQDPPNGATGVAIGRKIAVTFSEPMDPLTITRVTYTLYRGITPVAGTVTYVGLTATFAPNGNLAPNTTYTARIKPGAKDLAGNAITGSANSFVWSFTTGANPDTTAPVVSFTVPANVATGVAVSQKIAVTFSEAMDPLTTTPVTFTLKQGTTPVVGTVTYAGVTATFNPSSTLAPDATYTATITTGTRDLAGNSLANTFVWSFTTGAGLDATPPTVSFTVPANAATGVPISQKIAATFSEAMDPLTTTTLTFTLKQGTTPVVGTVIYAGVTATFNPLSPLAPSTTYTATVTTGTKDLAGNALANSFVWSFTTGATLDTTAPTVSFTVPANAAAGVAISQKIAATFSEAMDPLTTTPVTFTLKQGATPVVGTVVYVGLTATFTPLASLAPLTVYTATISGARDLAGNVLFTAFSWSFTTSLTPDTTAPTVSFTVPPNGATGVPINQTINATFSEAMDPLTITTASLRLTGPGGTAVTGIVAYDVPSKIASFKPVSNLAPNAVYTATITIGARDLARNALAANIVWSFTTAATAAGQSPIALRSASTFVVLAASTVTSTGNTTVNGDLGLSPGTAVTGFPPGIVNGTIHAGDSAAALAQADLTTAYNDAVARTVGAIGVAGNLGGQTLTPGLYKSTSSLEISSGDLTLDAQGDPNAVFIFQIASTLTTTSGRQVILSGGAKAANIYWQVGSSATLGTISVFKGNILAMASITVTTGAAVEGRLLARSGAVTLDSNIVGVAIPADITAPTVSFTVPVNAAAGVVISGKIAVAFSEAMNASTISSATFTLKQGITAVAGTVSYAGITATFTPAVNLAPLTTYTATMTSGARDLAGNALAANFVWTFTTGATPDTTAPTVVAIVPANVATGVAINHNVTAAFSEAMDPLTISPVTFTLKQGVTAVPGIVSYAGLTATFSPAVSLAPLTVYTASISSGAKDLAGNALFTAFSWSFTTGATPDTSAPTISSTVPANGATAVPINQTINATFSEAMDPLTINTASLKLIGPGVTLVAGTVAYDVVSRIATLNPLSNLAPNSVYTATITIGTRDLAGNALTANLVWSFTTAATAAGQAPIALGSASTFAVLAASTVTSTGNTTVNGDLGLSPGTAVTGFPPGIVNGTIHAGNPAAAQAQLDLTAAYNDAAGRTLGAIGVAGNLGGQTLTPGLYKSTTSLEISSGDLTLDAQGDANAVFIFQMGSTLTTTVGRKVILSNGARAANVFWQVGSSATLGTSSVFKGNILAMASITVTTGAIVEGRLLARTAAVTLDSNVVGVALPAGITALSFGGETPVALGSAGTFAVLAASTVTSTGGTTVNGDLGLSPGIAVTGSPTVNGTIHIADAAAAQAQADLTIAYNDLAGRTVGAIGVAGNLGGQTLTPGLYKSTSSLEISSGDLTLDAQGDTNAVFIFQMASTLTTTSGRQVNLSGGAQAANIYWQVGSSATLGSTSVFKGSILAMASITVTTGATVEGRLLARTAAVTLDSNTVGVGLGSPTDTTPPTVNSTVPVNASTGVLINQHPSATFNEAMDPATISTATFTVNQGATPVTGTVTYAGTTATFAPASALAVNTTYTATITTGVKDLAGNAMASNLAWSFTTAAATYGQAPVALGSAGTFAVLAASTVTSTGGTTVNGDLGLSPGIAVTGSPTVNGTIHIADAAAAQAQADLTTAYNEVAARTVGAIGVIGNLGGQTLTPGLYKSTSSLAIDSGDLTLDAQGDANAVFIFQMASTLTTTSGRQVILSGGAKAANIYWQVGSSATLGTTSVFKGNILAMASVTVTTGASVEGRLLARTAAVTLDTNTITVPAP